MTTASPNVPTEGPGGLPVFDAEGVFVGRVRDDEDAPAPSEDVARVVIELSEEARRRFGLRVDAIDVEASWLRAPDEGDRLVLDKPLGLALEEQGFDT